MACRACGLGALSGFSWVSASGSDGVGPLWGHRVGASSGLCGPVS